jgi:hypothetical protein
MVNVIVCCDDSVVDYDWANGLFQFPFRRFLDVASSSLSLG